MTAIRSANSQAIKPITSQLSTEQSTPIVRPAAEAGSKQASRPAARAAPVISKFNSSKPHHSHKRHRAGPTLTAATDETPRARAAAAMASSTGGGGANATEDDERQRDKPERTKRRMVASVRAGDDECRTNAGEKDGDCESARTITQDSGGEQLRDLMSEQPGAKSSKHLDGQQDPAANKQPDDDSSSQQVESAAAAGAAAPLTSRDSDAGSGGNQDGLLTNLIVNYLPQSMSQEEIRTLFSSIGEVESCKLIRDKSTINQSLGYGFVNYVKPEDAQRAIKSFNGLRLQNKTIKVSYARPSSESIKGANLYVSGLPKSMTQLELEQLFRPHGKIITSRILCDNLTGISKGVGFVRFDQRFEAERAIEHLNNTYIQITNNTVNVSRQPPPPPPTQQQQQLQPPSNESKQQSQAASQQTSTSGDQVEGSKSGGGGDQKQDQQQQQQQACSPTPIIVKFANSPSSNPQKQLAGATSTPTSAHLLASALHPLGGGASLGAYLGGGGGGASGAGGQPTLAGGTGPQIGGRPGARFAPAAVSQQHQQQGPIFHYPANRFRYSPMASDGVGLCTSAAFGGAGGVGGSLLLNPFGASAAAFAAAAAAQLGAGSGGQLAAPTPVDPMQSLFHAVVMSGGPSTATATTATPPTTTSPYPRCGGAPAARLHQQQLQASGATGGGAPVAAMGQPLEQHAHRLAAASASAGGHLSGWCLFVYNLAPEIEENVIWKLFGPFGAVQQVNLVKDSQTNKCKGFAFVTMSDYNQALLAIQSLNGYTLANRVIQVSFKTNKVRRTMGPKPEL